MDPQLIHIETPSDFEAIFPIIHQLRPHLTPEIFKEACKEAKDHDSYQIVALKDEGRFVAAMGYRILTDLTHGRHLYIDDLVTVPELRSQGYGRLLLEYAEFKAREMGLGALRLCTGMERERTQQFYDRNGWTKRSFAYKKYLN